MTTLRHVLLIVAAIAVSHGVQACATEEPGAELNPQPLPPSDDNKQVGSPPNEPSRSGESADNAGYSSSGGGAGSGTGSSSGGTAPGANTNDGGDAGTDSGGGDG